MKSTRRMCFSIPGITLMISGITLSLFVVASGQDGSEPRKDQSVQERWLKSDNPESVRHELRQDRQKVLDALETIIIKKDLKGRKRIHVVAAILALGDLKGTEKVALLASLLDFHVNESGISETEGAKPPPDREVYPALGALIQVGSSCIPSVLEFLIQNDVSDRARYNAILLLVALSPEGRQEEHVRQQIVDLHSRTQQPDAKKRAELLLRAFEKWSGK